MGTGWRRAFCTSIPRDPENAVAPEKQQNNRQVLQQLSPSSSPSNMSQNPGSCVKFGVFSGGGSSNPSSLRLRCRTADTSSEHPLLSPALDYMSAHHCKNGDFTTPYTPPPPSSAAGVKGSPRLLLTRSNPASPRSPSRFALLKATLRLSRSRCGICSQSVRTGQRTAVFTAECSHSFHFPCISTHVRTQAGCLSCPVCSASWREVPLLSSAHLQATPLPPSSTNKDLSNLNDSSKTRIQRVGENYLKQSGSNKKYDDDEPLLLSSATQGGGARAHHFNPIPEADLEDEAEGGISYGRNGVEVGGCGVEVVVLPEAALVSAADRNHQNYVILLRVKAPAFAQRSVSRVAASVLDPSCRAPIDLVTVLDVSGSMTSAAKLQMLKRAMRLLISSLGSSDRLSIVAFSAGAKRLLPLVRMSRQGQRSARQIVDRLIICGGGGGDNGVQGDCRCIGHALRKATKVLEDRRERNPVATIMLLSDSHQEQKRGKEGSSSSSPRLREGETDIEKHLRNPIPSSTETVATRFAHLEIPIGCSAELSGDGVNQVEDVFSKCVSGLVSLVLQDVHLQLSFPSAFVSSIYSFGTAASGGGEGCVGLPLSQGQGGNGAISVRLGDFYAEEKRELLVELRLPAPPPPPPPPQQQRNDLLSYKCCYRDPTSRELVLCQERSVVLPSLRQISPTAVSSRELRNLFITTRALVESRRLADHNDLEAAAHLLSTARSLLIQSNSAPSHHQKYVTSLELRLSEVQRRHRRQQLPSSSSVARASDQLTPTSAWRAAEQLAKVAILRKSMSRVGDLHGFENARF